MTLGGSIFAFEAQTYLATDSGSVLVAQSGQILRI
jgi:hypothetical protein